MEGLAQNGAHVRSISTRPINRAMTAQRYFRGEKERENGIDYDYVPFLHEVFKRSIRVFSYLSKCC